jgi:hypothetical protein
MASEGPSIKTLTQISDHAKLSILSESIRTILDTSYLLRVDNKTLYICHSCKDKMHWLVNDVASSLVFGHAKVMDCDYVHFHYYGRVSVNGGLAYIRNTIATYSNQLKDKEFKIQI